MRLWFPNGPLETAQLAGWVASQIPHMNGEGFGPCSAIGVVDDQNRIVGGIVYTDHQPQYGNIYLSFAFADKRWPTRQILSAFLRYPFTQLGCQRVTAITPSDPTTSVWQFLQRFGFSREGRIRKGLKNADAEVWGLLASEWRTNRFNVERQVVRKRRRKRRHGTLHLEHSVH